MPIFLQIVMEIELCTKEDDSDTANINGATYLDHDSQHIDVEGTSFHNSDPEVCGLYTSLHTCRMIGNKAGAQPVVKPSKFAFPTIG